MSIPNVRGDAPYTHIRDVVDTYLRRQGRLLELQANETYAAIALVLATITALIWANTGNSYHHFWQTTASIDVGPFGVGLTLHEWVDEGLMAVFFFMVGLDVRRELTLGELRLPGRALLPTAAAVGGLVVPALIYLAVMGGSEGAHAWGSVISTDTAFALGMLALIGPRRAPRLRLFLLAFAVIDDIGALAVIAIFYSESLNYVALAAAVAGLLGVWLMARRGVWHVPPYLALAVVIWYAVYCSGVHATLAGVLIGLLMPVYNVRSEDVDAAGEFAALYRQAPAPGSARMLREALNYSMPLNQRVAFVLPPYVNYLVVPLFALANAGVELSAGTIGAAVSSRILWAVVGGLVVGKLLGVVIGAGLVAWLVPASRMPGLDLPRITGLGALSGMGFTISLLVANIALEDEVLRDQARLGVLLASLLALVLATLVFQVTSRIAPLPEPAGLNLCRPPEPEHELTFGSLDAPHVLINYADMDDADRWRLTEALYGLKPLIDSGNVLLILRHKLSGSGSLLAALALEAASANDEPSLWDFHDALAGLRGGITSRSITRAARQVGVDAHAMWERIDSGVDEAKVLADASDVEGLTDDAGPVVYIDGRRFERLLNRWTFSEEINRLQQAAAGGTEAARD
ncbi:Na+/H+ antiporter NhaA [Actinomyces sp. 432]|uniref:Na+/H+ antiporter NhaA n=1 Tax=unclassified Actinomyces TaxID=2609248 RepID=UPI0013746E88|nr:MULTISPECIES: Na+/H+ antiporter NhaA [unclassified Actinomyces]MBW3069165.1 Na+/H+ antiporter NhaA [Actinomyces sp. 594]QHO91000.1 Na+/H+ antiporter NhaA [Actinomyces sp. 432]